ncbi:cytidine deaminase [Pyrobaculum sp. 3827-6]|jgi:cytidine deaminase|uniref:cytidine deaminase n=1 Tax=Pyrobaculum sp. 3827-6 TaxID=2983604 RepID=UPI0021DB57A3|nr:cytidine deaminase [Pyrobaculum sp. 3827-6]MCU7788107.1 cytidine deaminase [Pyrobaculum sp. 3827-6]
MEELIERAKEVIGNAYAPYSKFRVAAVVKTKSGKIYTGVNIENASYGLTVCAERVAVFKAVSEGDRDIEAVVVYTDTEEPTPPCGACRQVIAEFNPHALIIMASRKKVVETNLSQLLPNAFTGEKLRG